MPRRLRRRRKHLKKNSVGKEANLHEMTKTSKALSSQSVVDYHKKALGPGSDERNYFSRGKGPGATALVISPVDTAGSSS
jgi:hypothetical protein